MNGAHHLIVGAATYAVACGYAAWAHLTPAPDALASVLGCACCLLGSVAPDIDSERSLVGRYIHLPVEHRTITHALWIPVFCIVVGLIWAAPLAWFGLGWLSHIAVDGLSRAGVCYLWPLTDYVRYDSGAFVARDHKSWLKWYGSDTPGRERLLVVAIVALVALLLYFFSQVPAPVFDTSTIYRVVL